MAPDGRADTTDDALLGGAVTLRQPRRGYRVTSDSVLLAALAPLAPSQRVVDLGTGYGQIALCLLAREPTLHVTGVELLPEVATLARENAHLNTMADRFTVVEADLKDWRPSSASADLVVANPPYRTRETHTPSPDRIKAAATVEQTSAPLRLWVRRAHEALIPGGAFLMSNDTQREEEVVRLLLDEGFHDALLLPLAPREAVPARRFIVKARKPLSVSGASADPPLPVRRLPPLIVHEADGQWCAAVAEVLRHPLELNVFSK